MFSGRTQRPRRVERKEKRKKERKKERKKDKKKERKKEIKKEKRKKREKKKKRKVWWGRGGCESLVMVGKAYVTRKRELRQSI